MTKLKRQETSIIESGEREIQRKRESTAIGTGKSVKPRKKPKRYKHLVFQMGNEEFTI